MERLQSLRLIFFVAFLALVPGLVHLQFFSYERFRTLSESNSTRTIYLDIPRGRILDRNGKVLAEDRVGYNLSYIPFDIGNREVQAGRLSEMLDLEKQEILRQFEREHPNPFEPRILARDLDMGQMHRLEEKLHLLPGMTIQPGLVRHYPLGSEAAHLVGYLGEVSREELSELRTENVRMGDLVGRTGIESSHDRFLRGRRGGKIIEVDARGRRIRELGHRESKPGGDIVLNIDIELQAVAARELSRRSGAAIVMCPESGEVLALVSRPSFDPSRPAEFLRQPNYPFMNRVLQAEYPPGSVFKIVTAIAGLESGVVRTMDSPDAGYIRSIRDSELRRKLLPEDVVLCEGYVEIGDRRFHCWHEDGHGWVAFMESMAISCNIYFGRTGMDVGNLRLLDFANRIGLGRATGIDLPGERSGLVPEPRFSGGALNLSIGQGALLTTPLQLAVMTSAIANEGNIMRPRLLRQKNAPGGSVEFEGEPTVERHFFLSGDTMGKIKQSLVGVVESGTGRQAAVPGVTVGGKTGTVQVAHRDLGMASRAIFACYTEHPERPLVMVAVLDRAAWGWEAAVPAGNVLREYYRRLAEEKDAVVHPLPDEVIPDTPFEELPAPDSPPPGPVFEEPVPEAVPAPDREAFPEEYF